MLCSSCNSPRGRLPRNGRKHGREDLCSHCYGMIARSVRNSRVSPKTKRKWNVATRYGLTVEQVKEMERQQNGRCAICAADLGNYHIDHNHKTGKVRGLLCHACNLKLPLVESPDLLQAAINYLKRSDGA